MRAGKRLIFATMAVGLIAALPGSALAQDRAETDVVATDHISDRPVDRPSDKRTEWATDRPVDKSFDRPADRPTDKPTDRCVQSVTDRPCVDEKPTDRPTDRCLSSADHPSRCIDDHHHHDINVRKLIWRLINAHEWEKLVRLLHWLGWL